MKIPEKEKPVLKLSFYGAEMFQRDFEEKLLRYTNVLDDRRELRVIRLDLKGSNSSFQVEAAYEISGADPTIHYMELSEFLTMCGIKHSTDKYKRM